MKRGVLVCCVTVVLLLCFGAMLHAPPAFLDGVSGATRRVDKEPGVLEGSYLFCFNTRMMDGETAYLWERMKAVAEGETLPPADGEHAALRISLKEDDPALLAYAGDLCQALSSAGVQAGLRTYSDQMFRARLLSGKFDAFLSTRGYMDIELLDGIEYVILDGEEMQQQFA